jgi:hypothetical protein
MADLDATSVMPAIGSGPRPPQSLDSTMMLPLIAEGQRLDETVMLPMLRINDATSVLPRLSQRSDETMLVPLVRQPPPDEVLMGERPADEIGVTALRRARAVLVEALIVAVIAAVWLFSLVGTSTANVGDYGLISVLRPGFFVAVIACVARFVIELSRPRWRGWVLFTHTVLLVAIMHATVPLLVYEPEYAWTYKHVGVVELLRTQGHITNPLDIYQAWPTLFALVGHIVDGSGMNSLRIAAWAPVFFDLAFCVPLFAIARTLSSDRRVPYLTIFLFSAVDWVAQDYLSPQAYTYVLGLGTTFIMLRWLRRTTGRHGGPPGRIARLWAWVESGLAEVPYPSKIASRTATAVLYILYFVVVASHQLSPYLILMTACVLVALGLVRPLRIVFVLLAIAVAYLAPRYDIAGNYGLFSSFDFFNNAQSVSPVQGTTAGRVMSAQVVQYLSLVMWALAALTVVASWRRPGPIAVPAVLAFSPFGLLVLQSYGGEAIYRVYLFSIPWCAYLVATLMLRKRWLPRGMALPGAVVLLTLAIFGSMQGSHGQIIFNQFTRDEVAASTFIYSHAEPGADIVLVAGNFPTRLTANYDQFAAGANGDRGLLPDTDLEGLKLTPADLPKLNTFFDEKIPSYLVFSPSMKNYLHYFAYVPDGVYDQLRVTINGSPNWHIVYLNGDIAIYKFVP